jgi:predicted transcriptional regulator
MTVREIADAVGKTERAVRNWVAKVAGILEA